MSLRASAGDRYIVLPRGRGQDSREGVVVEVRGPAGSAPYVVQWSDDASIETLVPGPDALVLHYERSGHEPVRRRPVDLESARYESYR
jgi:hypothetical protein